jgi:SAM-dependent methyltransferase
MPPPRGRTDDRRAHDNRRRAESFGPVAAAYDRARPSYPPALIDALLARHPADVLDVGCGTGKAAVLLAARGVPVLGVEVDARMAEVARQHGVAVEVGAFETWPAAGRRFDLIVSGQAWHWIDPVAGALKAFSVLRPGGALALFWNIGDVDEPIGAALDAVYAEVAPSMPRSVLRGGNRGIEPYLPGLAAAGFGAPEHRSYPWTQTYSTRDWLELAGTHSDHSTLPPRTRARLLARLGATLDAAGGQVAVRYVTETLVVAR